MARERDIMSMMFANNNRFDPMTLALANSFQVIFYLSVDVIRKMKKKQTCLDATS